MTKRFASALPRNRYAPRNDIFGRFGASFIFVSVYFILLFALFLTFSRGIILIFLFVLAFWFFWLAFKDKSLRAKIFYAVLILAISYTLLGSIFYRQEIKDRYRFFAKEEAVSFRIFYTELVSEMIDKNPILGVGWGNFVPRMNDFLVKPLKPWDRQPVHNVFLLIGAEAGLAALAVFIWFLASVIKKTLSIRYLVIKNFLFLFLALILYGLFDHFFWTLQPAKLIFWLVLGMLSNTTPYNNASHCIRDSAHSVRSAS
ncbi:MAG: O-antigen ligase family protein [bacterium]|nr:O-antigen ligase family protein [bacterium]